MKKLPNILKFAILFIGIYFGLSLAHQVPVVKKINLAVYTTMQQTVFNAFHPTVRTDFDVLKDKQAHEAPFDFQISIFDKKNKGRKTPMAKINQGARLLSIVPFVFLLALVLSSPANWKRKIIGLIVSGIFLLIYLSLKYTHLFDTNASQLSPDGFSLWMTLSKIFIPCYRTHEAMFVLIIPIWILSTLNFKDLKWFLD